MNSFFVIYEVSTPELLPNGHLFMSAEMFHCHFLDLKVMSQTPTPPSETHSHEAWNLSTHSKDDVDESVVSGSNKSNVSLESYSKACSKPYEFISGRPLSSPYGMSFVKFCLPKWQKLKFEELSVTNQFEVLTKYTQVLHDVIDIDDKVHLVGNHSAPVWADRGIDTCIPWQVHMPCSFNIYDENDQKVTSYSMPKEVYGDGYSFVAHWYLSISLRSPTGHGVS